MAAQLDDQTNLAILARLQGQMAAREGDTAAAEQHFGRSVEILETIDPYQAAVAKLTWGEQMLALQQLQKGEKLVREAHRVFADLGAQREEKNATNLLAA